MATRDNSEKRFLTRGIDAIPDDWELAYGLQSIAGLRRSLTTLARLIDQATAAGDKATARDLRRVRSAAELALHRTTGGFDRRVAEPLAAKIAAAREQARVKVQGLKAKRAA